MNNNNETKINNMEHGYDIRRLRRVINYNGPSAGNKISPFHNVCKMYYLLLLLVTCI